MAKYFTVISLYLNRSLQEKSEQILGWADAEYKQEGNGAMRKVPTMSLDIYIY